MSWRPSNPRPNPLSALRRIVERPGGDARGEAVRMSAGAGVLVPPRHRPVRHTPVVRRPASEPEPSHRSPDRMPEALITTTPGPARPELRPLAPVPAVPGERVGAPVITAPLAFVGTPAGVPALDPPALDPPALDPPALDPPALDPPALDRPALPAAPAARGPHPPVSAGGPSGIRIEVEPEPGSEHQSDDASDHAAATAPSLYVHAPTAGILVPAAVPVGLVVLGPTLPGGGASTVLHAPVPPTIPARPAGSERRHLNVRQVFTAAVACLALWTLIDSPALARSAEHSTFGTRRTVALDVLHPVSRLAAALGLDRVDRWVQELRGHPLPPPHRATPAGHPLPLAPAPVHPTPPPTLPPLRVPTAADPLRVLVVGDSLGLSFGQSLARKLDATGLTTTTVDAREGTGLTRPDSFDWPSQLRADIVRFRPELVVASFGGNDDQDVQLNGRFIPFNSPQWQSIYASRVQQVAATARAANTHLVWDGLPIMRSAAKSARLAAVMNLTRTALANDTGALFVDNAATLADTSGHYQVALPNASGTAVIVRQPDGIHETVAGADRLADKVIAAMRTRWHVAF